MKTEELAKVLLDEAPEQWPVQVRAFALPDAAMPDTTRARIRTLIRDAVRDEEEEVTADESSANAEEAGTGSPAWRWLAAAVLPVALAAGVGYYMWTGQTQVPSDYQLEVAHVSGEVARLESDGNRVPLAADETILEGQRLVLGADGVLGMKNEVAVFWLGGEGDFEVRKLRKDPDPDIEVFVHFGNISIRSDYAGDKSVVFSTRSLDTTMTGTQARFTVDEEYEVLEVLEGSFDVRLRQSPDTVRTVGAGEVFTYQVDAGGGELPENREMLDIEIEDLELLMDQLEAIQKGQDPALAERRSFDTEEEIREHFGALQEVTLGDGRVYRGYVKVNGDQISIYTTFNVIEVSRSMVASIKDL